MPHLLPNGYIAIRHTPARMPLRRYYARGKTAMTQQVNTTFSAQFTGAWDGTTLKVEIPGKNGARQKVEVLFSELPFNLREQLMAAIAEQRDAARKALIAQQNENVKYVLSEHHPHGAKLARKVWGNKGEGIISKTMQRKLAKAGQFDPD